MNRFNLSTKEEEFNIAIHNINKKADIKKVIGKRITIGGLRCFIFMEYIEGRIEEESYYSYNISELETGMRISKNKYRRLSLSEAEEIIKNQDTGKSLLEAREALLNLGYELPINK